MLYKIILEDKSFMIVKPFFTLMLFNDLEKLEISVEDYYKQMKSGYYLKNINNTLIQFYIESTDNKENYPLNTLLKKVQDVNVGDILLGPDNLPREVLELHTGQDEMYELESEDGEKHIVNKGHILYLHNEITGEDLDIPLEIYLQLDDELKQNLKLIKVDLEGR